MFLMLVETYIVFSLFSFRQWRPSVYLNKTQRATRIAIAYKVIQADWH